jgi:hypothetical protein
MILKHTLCWPVVKPDSRNFQKFSEAQFHQVTRGGPGPPHMADHSVEGCIEIATLTRSTRAHSSRSLRSVSKRYTFSTDMNESNHLYICLYRKKERNPLLL